MFIHKDVITSRNNPLVKLVASLADKKGRMAEKCFIAEGEKLTYEAIDAGLPVTKILIREDKYCAVIDKLKAALDEGKLESVEIFLFSAAAFEKISTEKAPQGVISVIKYLDFFSNIDIIYNEEIFSENERVLALYSLRDPSNLGSVIRSAVAFGVEHIIISSDTADVYNPKTVRSAMGSLFKVKITSVSDFASFVDYARKSDRRVLAAELTDSAVSLSDVSLRRSDIVVIGNEGHGISPEISALCDKSVYIPISEKTESLNASVAASLFMWEQSKL